MCLYTRHACHMDFGLDILFLKTLHFLRQKGRHIWFARFHTYLLPYTHTYPHGSLVHTHVYGSDSFFILTCAFPQLLSPVYAMWQQLTSSCKTSVSSQCNACAFSHESFLTPFSPRFKHLLIILLTLLHVTQHCCALHRRKKGDMRHLTYHAPWLSHFTFRLHLLSLFCDTLFLFPRI